MQRDPVAYEHESEYAGTGPYPVGPSLLEALSRFRWLVVGVSIAAAVAGYGLSLLQATSYEAEATMLLTDPRTSGVFEDSSSGIRDLSRYVRNQAEFTESSAVAARASGILGDGLTVKEITESVSATPSRDLDLVTIQASQPTAAEAAALANAIGDAYQQLVAEQVQATAAAAITELADSKAQLQSRVDTLEVNLAADPGNAVIQAERDAAIAQLLNLDTRIAQIDVNMALYGSGVQYFEAAEIPESRAAPRPLRNAAAAAVLGLLAAGAYAWWRTERSPLAEHRHDPAPVLGAPLLGEVPEFSSVGVKGPAPVIHDPESSAAEAYQFVASSVEFALDRISGSVVLVTSAGADDGKTVTSLNLAAAATGDGSRVLLIDADERVRGLTKMGGDGRSPGLTDLVQDGVGLGDCVVRWKVTDDRHVMVLPAGAPLPIAAGLFRTQAFSKVMGGIRDAAGLVILDSPPVLAAAETLDIAAQVDGVVLVVNQGTPLQALGEVRARLEMTDKPILGYVFNRATHGPGSYGKYYSYGYRYGRGG